MIICIDVGNTSTKVGAVSAAGVLARRVIATGDIGDGHALSAAIADVARDSGETPVAVAVASVVDGAVDAVRDATPSGPVVEVDHGTSLPIRLSVDRPETVGPDRICAASGAVDATCRDAIVVDIGSAVTVDRVSDLEFIGGAILPGPQMMLSALGGYTSRLPALRLSELETLFPVAPQPTANAIAFGVGAATVGGILEAVRRLCADDDTVPVWVTGGQAHSVDARLPGAWTRDPDLTLRGLFRVARCALGRPA